MKRTKRIYKAKPGAPFTQKNAQQIGEEIEKLGESVTPAELVSEAKRNTVLKKYFTWDDRKAAHDHRLWQARHLLGSLSVVVEMPNGDQKELRAFYSQKVESSSVDDEGSEEVRTSRRYMHISVVEREPELARDVIGDAKRELREWKTRYSDYSAYFGPVFAAIEQVA